MYSYIVIRTRNFVGRWRKSFQSSNSLDRFLCVLECVLIMVVSFYERVMMS